MKSVVLFGFHVILFLFICASEADDAQWEYIPKENGEMILVDINSIETVTEDPEPIPIPPSGDFKPSSIFPPSWKPTEETKFKLIKKVSNLDPSTPYDELAPSIPSFMLSTFNSSWPTRFFIHGWQGDEGSVVNYQVIREYFKHGNYNCIIVDWSRGSGGSKAKANANFVDSRTLKIILGDYWYPTARKRIDDVAKLLADLIKYAIDSQFMKHSEIHLIGHSLGAHLAGITGKYVFDSTGKKIKAIFGLDPAGPLFGSSKPKERLTSTDADYVEVIHTDAFATIKALGFQKPIGDTDIYPNYGRRQPGCLLSLFSCSHLRAPTYFAESINKSEFYATKCRNFEEVEKTSCSLDSDEYFMSPENSDFAKARGVFHYKTDEKFPFGVGRSLKSK